MVAIGGGGVSWRAALGHQPRQVPARPSQLPHLLVIPHIGPDRQPGLGILPYILGAVS